MKTYILSIYHEPGTVLVALDTAENYTGIFHAFMV